MPSPTTVLDIAEIQSSPYATRGLTQTLESIDAATALRRTVNGELIAIGAAQFRKYRSSITGNDQVPPAFDGIWPGMAVTVACMAELSYKTAGGSPARTPVAGSSRVDGDHTFYRPLLMMRVVRVPTSHDEFGAQVGWTLELEEI